jgi:hypothetical protein
MHIDLTRSLRLGVPSSVVSSTLASQAVSANTPAAAAAVRASLRRLSTIPTQIMWAAEHCTAEHQRQKEYIVATFDLRQVRPLRRVPHECCRVVGRVTCPPPAARVNRSGCPGRVVGDGRGSQHTRVQHGLVKKCAEFRGSFPQEDFLQTCGRVCAPGSTSLTGSRGERRSTSLARAWARGRRRTPPRRYVSHNPKLCGLSPLSTPAAGWCHAGCCRGSSTGRHTGRES